MRTHPVPDPAVQFDNEGSQTQPYANPDAPGDE
jgi:hypothetical protein